MQRKALNEIVSRETESALQMQVATCGEDESASVELFTMQGGKSVPFTDAVPPLEKILRCTEARSLDQAVTMEADHVVVEINPLRELRILSSIRNSLPIDLED